MSKARYNILFLIMSNINYVFRIKTTRIIASQLSQDFLEKQAIFLGL